MSYTPNQRDIDRLIEQFHSNETRPNTNWTAQFPTLVRNEQPHTKLYLAKREQSNLDNDFRNEQEILETISEQLKKRARPEKRSKQGKESSHCGSSDYAAPMPNIFVHLFVFAMKAWHLILSAVALQYMNLYKCHVHEYSVFCYVSLHDNCVD